MGLTARLQLVELRAAVRKRTRGGGPGSGILGIHQRSPVAGTMGSSGPGSRRELDQKGILARTCVVSCREIIRAAQILSQARHSQLPRSDSQARPTALSPEATPRKQPEVGVRNGLESV